MAMAETLSSQRTFFAPPSSASAQAPWLQRKVSGRRFKCGRAQQRECKNGGLIAFQPSRFETHCLSTSMTGQPFLRLDAFPPSSRKTWNVRQSAVSSRLNRGSCGLHGLHRLPSFLAGVGFIVFCGFVAQKVVDIRHPSWCRHPRWQGRAAFFQSAFELQMGVSAFGGIDMRIMPVPALAGPGSDQSPTKDDRSEPSAAGMSLGHRY